MNDILGKENVEDALNAVITILKRIGQIASDDERVQEVIDCEYQLAYIHWRADLTMRLCYAYQQQQAQRIMPVQDVA